MPTAAIRPSAACASGDRPRFVWMMTPVALTTGRSEGREAPASCSRATRSMNRRGLTPGPPRSAGCPPPEQRGPQRSQLRCRLPQGGDDRVPAVVVFEARGSPRAAGAARWRGSRGSRACASLAARGGLRIPSPVVSPRRARRSARASFAKATASPREPREGGPFARAVRPNPLPMKQMSSSQPPADKPDGTAGDELAIGLASGSGRTWTCRRSRPTRKSPRSTRTSGPSSSGRPPTGSP